MTLTTYGTDSRYVGGVAGEVGYVAYQDGDGPWRPLAGDGGVYRAPITRGRYGLALVCEGLLGRVVSVQVRQATVDEARDWTLACPGVISRSQTGPVGFQFYLPYGLYYQTCGPAVGCQGRRYDGAEISVGSALYAIGGPFDLGIGRYQGLSGPITDYYLLRDLRPGVDAAVPFDPEQVERGRVVPLDVLFDPGAPTASQKVETAYVTSRGATLPLELNGPAALELPAPRPDDVHWIHATALDQVAAGTTTTAHERSVERFARAPSEVRLSARPALDGVAFDWQGDPRLRARFIAAPGAAYYELSFQSSNNLTRETTSWTARVTAGWLGTAASHEYAMPDLREAEGWDPAWDRPSATTGLRVVSFSAVGTTRDFAAGETWDRLRLGVPSDGHLDGLERWRSTFRREEIR